MKYYSVTAVNGETQLHPFKEWFRSTQNVSDAHLMTTHQMRNHMKHLGWSVKTSGEQVLIVEPGSESGAIRASEDLEPAHPEIETASSAESSLFALESHLRDYLAKNLNVTVKFPTPLTVVGVEYSTDVGPIDLLAKSHVGDHYIFELKLDRGTDAALGQLLRYMGWCKEHLTPNGRVFGIILASDISEKLRYAASIVPDVTLMEYELQIKVRPVLKVGERR